MAVEGRGSEGRMQRRVDALEGGDYGMQRLWRTDAAKGGGSGGRWLWSAAEGRGVEDYMGGRRD